MIVGPIMNFTPPEDVNFINPVAEDHEESQDRDNNGS